MSLSHETLLDLMALADGELDSAKDCDRKARVEALVASSDEARRALESFQGNAVGDWVYESQRSGVDEAVADSIADRVMVNVAASRAPVSLEAVRARRRNL